MIMDTFSSADLKKLFFLYNKALTLPPMTTKCISTSFGRQKIKKTMFLSQDSPTKLEHPKGKQLGHSSRFC